MRGMNKPLLIAVLLVILGLIGANAFGLFGFGGTSWQEEVLLHDGSRIIVERSQSYGGRHEVGQSAPIKEQKIIFSLPGTKQKISWFNEYGKDIGRANFELLALHILKGTPYIVTTPRLCLSYNKWGRPNPPYVVFKYADAAWQRIPLKELPAEFTTFNLTIETKGYEKEIVSEGLVSAEKIKKLNSTLRQPEFKTILREPLKSEQIFCTEMIPTVNGGWEGIEGFIHQPSYERCLWYCKVRHVDPELCPCDRLFNKINKER